MNKRIKELYTQVCMEQKLPFTVEHNSAVMLDAFASKFAELIVRECAGLFPNVYVEIENEYGHTPVIAADYIKKHFGVEE